MVIDTSALIAIMFGESDAAFFEAAIVDHDEPLISAASLLEASIVVERRYPDLNQDALDLLISRFGAKIVPVSAEQAGVARRAYRQYGRGRHKAGLNFGDCFSYALAKVSDEPLLYKGNDFGLTDLALISLPPSPQNT
jgi:ribonuclease VapC